MANVEGRDGGRRAMVVGAGAVGICAALQLQRRGFAVTVVEEGEPGFGASYGNSGMLVADTAMPTAQPGVLAKVPRWLLDPLGPLTVRLRYLPAAMPWLMRYVASGTRRQVFHVASALQTLHRTTFEGWEENVGAAAMARLTRRDGQVYLWEGEPKAGPPAAGEGGGASPKTEGREQRERAGKARGGGAEGGSARRRRGRQSLPEKKRPSALR